MRAPREITESFRLERVLKSSRSAIVFQAIDPATGKVVAIKLIPPGAPIELQVCQARFLAAMGALGSLAPTGFPLLLDHGFTPDGSAFMVMEFITGARLDTLAGSHPARILSLLVQAVESLQNLAEKSIAHGNLAPDNLYAVRHGEGESIKILGFGTAAFQVGAFAGAGLSLSEGPVEFAAPERLAPATAGLEPDWRADVYSLAQTACALLGADTAPQDAVTPAVILPPQVHQRLHDPVVLRAILEQSLRRDPAARPGSWDEFRQALALAHLGVTGRESSPPELALDEPFASAFEQPRAPSQPAIQAPAAAPPERAAPKVKTGPVPIHRLPEIPVQPATPETAPAETRPLPEAVEATGPTAAMAAQRGLPTEAAAAVPAAKAKGRSTGRRSHWRVVFWAAVVAAVAGGLWLAATTGALGGFRTMLVSFEERLLRPRTKVVAAPTPVPRKATPVAQPAAQPKAVTQLQTAEAAIALSDLVAARQALDAITPAELEALAAPEKERYASLRTAYNTQIEQTLAKELADSLARGDLKALADTLKGIPKEDAATFARNKNLGAALEEARRALNVQSLMLKAQRQGDWGEVLQQSTLLASLVPKYTQAGELRERAAVTLEREADTSASKGNYEVAQARLETVRRAWPERKGLATRVDRLRTEQAADQQLAGVLATVEQAEKDQAPEKGLAALAAAAPGPRWEERFRQARERLAQQLQQLDVAPPTLAVTPGAKLEYKKGEPGVITVRIQDDHGVKSARLFARVEGSVQYVELPLRRGSGPDYAAEISPGFHQNQTVEFYAVASDHSDHTVQLGSAQEPLKLKRKKWSLFSR